MNEIDLYQPIKRLFENQGFAVKAEIKNCDVVAVDSDGLLTIIELKVRFSLSLLMQGIERQHLSDMVYLAFPMPVGRRGKVLLKNAIKICRRLKLGVITVRLQPSEFVKVHCKPGLVKGLKSNSRKRSELLQEHSKLLGDPNIGGQVRSIVMTAYRQDAIYLANAISLGHKGKPSLLVKSLGIPNAGSILYKNHYGWFFKIDRGLYGLTDKGYDNLKSYKKSFLKLKAVKE